MSKPTASLDDDCTVEITAKIVSSKGTEFEASAKVFNLDGAEAAQTVADVMSGLADFNAVTGEPLES